MKTWKIQKFGSDLVYDLRSRGLLPLAVLLVLAIVAAPLLISSMGASGELPGPAVQSASVKPAPEGQAAVVNYSPGLRNYRDRLSGRGAKDPFVQQYRDQQGGDGGGGGAVAASGGQSTASSDAGGVTITGTTRSKLYYFFHETDLRAGESGGELKQHKDIDEFTVLPSENAPVLVYLGVAANGDTKKAIFSVSRKVTNVSGQGVCYPDPENCELLGVPAKGAADLVYSGDNKIYRVVVDRIRFVKSTQPPD